MGFPEVRRSPRRGLLVTLPLYPAPPTLPPSAATLPLLLATSVLSADALSPLLTCARARASRRYQVALKWRKPIMRVDWVQEAWRTGKRAISPSMLSLFSLPAFHGAKVCVTGLPDAEKHFISTTVSALGGKFSPSLDATCTHLVALERSGRK